MSSLASAASKMFSGTLVSRILGQIRLIVLIAALGYTAQADAFQVANTLPNTIYNLIAGGVMNAILVPHIVRAMKRSDNDFVNRLLTMAGTLLFVVTAILTFGSSILVTIFASQLAPEWFHLAVAFSFWCLPQVFFYGMYTLLGNVLNARGVFGPYMWAPVVNNIIAIIGLVAYIWLYGGADGATDPAVWDPTRIAVVGGFATAGVALQAIVLIIPLRRSGFRFSFRWGLRGAGLRSASTMAGWAFAALMVGQLGNLILVNVGSAANGVAAAVAEAGGGFVPSYVAYTGAFAIYMLPQSLITTSLVTALFTRMSENAAERNLGAVRSDLSLGLRVVGVFTVFASAAFMVLAIPLIQATLPTTSASAAIGFAALLVALSAGIPAQAAWMIVQRVSFAFEDAKTMFFVQIPMAIVVIASGIGVFLAPPQWWMVIVTAGMTVSNYLGGTIGYLTLRTKLRRLDGGRVVRTYFRLVLAVIPAALVGWGLLHLWGPVSAGSDLTRFVLAVTKVIVIGGIMGAIYFALLRSLKVSELDSILTPILRRLGRAPVGSTVESASRRADGAADGDGALDSAPEEDSGAGRDAGVTAVGRTYWRRLFGRGSTQSVSETDSARSMEVQAERKESALLPLGTGDLLSSRFGLLDLTHRTKKGAELWQAHDNVLDRDVHALLVPQALREEVLDGARRAALVSDPRLASVIEVGEEDGVGYVISTRPAGRNLAHIDPDPPMARAIVGESAAALNAGRRRGIHHGAFTRDCVTVTSTGDVVLLGTGYLGVVGALIPEGDSSTDGAPPPPPGEGAAGPDTETRDPIERSVVRSQLDADALIALYSVLGGDPMRIPARNAGDVMKAMTPWGEISLPLEPETERSAPKWKKPRERAKKPAVPAAGGPAAAAMGTSESMGPAAAKADPSQWKLPPIPDAASAPEFEEIFEGDDVARPASHVAQDLPATAIAAGAASAAASKAASAAATAAGAASTAASATGAAVGRWTKSGTAFARTQADRARELAKERAAKRSADAAAKESDEDPGPIPAGSQAHTLGPAERSEAERLQHPPRPTSPPGRRRINPTPFILALVLIGVVVALILAVSNLREERESVTLPPRTDPAVVAEPEPEPETDDAEENGDVEEEETPEESPDPVISTINILDPEGDGAENPELTDRAFDGDEGSYWRSRSYVNPEYGMKSGIGLDIVLEQRAIVSEIEILLHGEGGHVQIKDSPSGVRNADVIAEADMDRETVITIEDPHEFENVVLWFTSLPRADSDGKNRVELLEVRVR